MFIMWSPGGDSQRLGESLDSEDCEELYFMMDTQWLARTSLENRTKPEHTGVMSIYGFGYHYGKGKY